MFARILTGSKSKPTVSAKFLCDTGNLGRSLISEKFAQTLKWESHPCKHSIKSAQGNRVTITGETNPVSFVIQGHEQPFQWRFLIIRDLCAPGVFGIDFFNHFDVAIQMSKSGANFLTFGGQNPQRVPLVSPNAPNLPEMHEDNRFAGANVFRQRAKPAQTAAALQEEVGEAARGAAPGRPPDTHVKDALRGGNVGNSSRAGGATQFTEPHKGIGGKANDVVGEEESRGAEGGAVKLDATSLTNEQEVPEIISLKPEKRVKVQPHYRAWVKCRAAEGVIPSLAVLVDDDGLRGSPGRKQGIQVVETVNYMRMGKVSVLVENNSTQPVTLGPGYEVAQAHPMREPEVDWARGHYSLDQVCFILQQDKKEEEEGNKAWPTDEELQSRGPNSWWDPCKGMTEAERMLWVEEVFNLKDNEYLKKHPQWKIPYLTALAKYTDVVAGKGHVEAIPETTWVSMSLDTIPGARPIHQRPRPLSPPDQADLDRQLAIWLRQRVIVPAVEGAWALNLVPVRKKGVAAGVRRWTLDARGINSITEPRPEYIGSVASNLGELAGSDLYCQLDLSNAFLSIPIRPDHVHKASFVTPKSGAFSMTRSGYGFKNSPASLERLGTAIIRPIPPEFISKYMDDFLIRDKEPGNLLKTLCLFLDQIRAANVKIQASKCSILATRVVFLGHLVVGGEDATKTPGLYPDPELLRTILETPVPDCNASCKRFLGQLAFYSQFLVGISAITASLHQAKNRIPFKLEEKEKEDFKKALQVLANSPALAFPDFSDLKSRPFILSGDFSPVACNASLHQYQEGGLRLLGAVGRTNKGPAQRWGSMRGEAAAVRLGLDKWRHLLLRYWFPAITDNLSLTHAKTMKDPTGFWARFLEYISQYKMTFVHRAGIHGPVEDAWSRMAHHPEWSDQEKFNLADYEDEDDEEKGPGVPRHIPIGLRELLSKKSAGLDKPWEVQGASFKDPVKEKDSFLLTALRESLAESLLGAENKNQPELVKALKTLEQRSPEVAQSLMALATKEVPNETPTKKIAFFSDFEEDYDFPDSDEGFEPEDGREEWSATSSESENEEETVKMVDETLKCFAPEPKPDQDQPDPDHWVNIIRPEFRLVRPIPCRLSTQERARRQRVNPITREVMRWVSERKKPDVSELRGRPKDLQAYANMFEALHFRQGALYVGSVLGGESTTDGSRWCVPANSMADILDVAHVEDAKHMATESTINRLMKVAWWPSMRTDAEDFVAACPGCRAKHQAPKGHLLAIHKPRLQSRVNECWYLDLVGPLNVANTGHKHIFTCLDGFSRFVSAIPIRDKKAQTVIACLKAVVNLWGIPEEVFCDHGRELDNQHMRQEASRLGIKQYFAISYEARSNKVERYHRVQGSLLRAVLAETNEYEKWPSHLPDVVRAYNTSVHGVTGYTPYRLQTGREFHGPLRAWVGTPEDEDCLSLEEREKVKVRKRTLEELQAVTNQCVYQKRQCGLYQHKPCFKPEVGQKVFIYLPVAIKADNLDGYIARKLSSGWCGPWRVSARKTDQIFVVRPMDNDPKQERVISVDRMEPYREGHRYDSATTARPLPPDHPLVMRANSDPHAEGVIQSQVTEQEAANPWWPWSNQEAPFPAMPQQQQPAEPEHEQLQAMPDPGIPEDEIQPDAESGRAEGAVGGQAGLPGPHSSTTKQGERLGARPKWQRVRFQEPVTEARSRSPSAAMERRQRREEEVNKRRGVPQPCEMAELRPSATEQGNGGEEDSGGTGGEVGGEADGDTRF